MRKKKSEIRREFVNVKFEELLEKKDLFVSLERITVPRRILGEGTLSIVINISDDFGALFLQENKHLITTLQIDFAHNVMFSIIPDDFTEYDHSERFSGNTFKVYTKSRQLEFAEKMTPHSRDVFSNKKLLHYSIVCFEDNVDVFSYVEPTIIVVR
ncbi:hypothetical protein GH741_11235 [Aquibacillus halophilus]|uniref:Uncharacterized protein n=1 Tax=Aquibacillus halophilus TaxID=930132 RepID=A0A6A8DC38_9BACI|nr:hypothetical protein [Aquibacillus halophilus]MRH43253.1 hypothetical protein [Aquibacillus halophilus]